LLLLTVTVTLPFGGGTKLLGIVKFNTVSVLGLVKLVIWVWFNITVLTVAGVAKLTPWIVRFRPAFC
jgi:hypothetical protein